MTEPSESQRLQTVRTTHQGHRARIDELRAELARSSDLAGRKLSEIEQLRVDLAEANRVKATQAALIAELETVNDEQTQMIEESLEMLQTAKRDLAVLNARLESQEANSPPNQPNASEPPATTQTTTPAAAPPQLPAGAPPTPPPSGGNPGQTAPPPTS